MDVVDLREFYGSRVGNSTRRLIAQTLQPHLQVQAGATVVGLGFATPYLGGGLEGARATLAFMPVRQGVLQWPPQAPVSSALVDEFDLPLLESVADLVLVVHGLEVTDNPAEMLEEMWRVLAPQGRLLLVVPNRRGMWARFDSTPFGYGQPFSRPQLANLLKEARFSIMSWSQALFMPPIDRGPFLSSAPALERIGNWLMPRFAGVIVVEAVKQVYATSSGKRVRRLVPRLRPTLAPAPARFEPPKNP
jgi:SAM-dependent methyltransferase